MYRIEGDGSFQHTTVWRNGIIVPYHYCTFYVDTTCCEAEVDNIIGKLDSIVLKGIYMIIGNGSFSNTRVIVDDVTLRGVQSINGEISADYHPKLCIDTIMLPNIVEDVMGKEVNNG